MSFFTNLLTFLADMASYAEVSPALLQKGRDTLPRETPCSALRRVANLRPDELRRKISKWRATHLRAITRYGEQDIVCIVKPGATNKDGYQQVNLGSIDGIQQTAYYHHVVMWSTHGESGLPKSWLESVSHLCHHTDCVNPQHLVLEPHWKNIRRQACDSPMTCVCDEEHKCVLPPNTV
jgi:hypothetical protein